MKNNKRGFTLIEIVMVLVLLGILSAVAVPKYYDLKDKAEQQTALAVIAEYQARLNGSFAENLLGGKSCKDALDQAKTDLTGFKDEGHGYEVTLAATSTSGLVPATITRNSQAITGTFKVSIPKCSGS